MNKHWIATAVEYLTQSLEPVPHEINELDLCAQEFCGYVSN